MNDIEVQSKFVAELNTLLMKYKVEMIIEYSSRGDYILFSAAPQYDDNGNLIAEDIVYAPKEM